MKSALVTAVLVIVVVARAYSRDIPYYGQDSQDSHIEDQRRAGKGPADPYASDTVGFLNEADNSNDKAQLRVYFAGKKETKLLKEIAMKVGSLENHEVNSNLDSKIDSVLSNLTDVINNMKDDLDSKLDSIMEEKGCPEGTFNVSSSNQCFKFLGDKHRTFEDGKAACKALGLQLAQPNDPVALQKYLVPSQEHHQWSWLGARGDGSNFKWESNGEIISASNPLWWPGHPGNYVSSTYCLVLFTNQGMMNSQPNKVIGANTCTKLENTICEYMRN